MPTLIDASGAKYPKTFNGNTIMKNEGISMLPLFKKGTGKVHDYFYWEHEENCAIRHGNWKAVKKLPKGKWELYDLEHDRTETKNIAATNPAIVKQLDQKWQAWADSHKVFPKGRIYFKRYK